MKKLIFSLIIIFVCSSCASIPIEKKKWTTQDTILETSWIVIHAVDWGQTRTIAKNPKQYREMNPILGEHPSTQNVDLYMGASLLLHPLTSYLLPKPYRTWFQSITIFGSGSCVINNLGVGIKMDW
jgi:hypothetical protein